MDKNNIKKMRLIKNISFLIFFVSFNIHGLDQVSTGRYSTTSLKSLSEQINPLLAVAKYKFPANVNTVGEAIKIVLHQTGYELVDDTKQSKHVQLSLKKPLPVTVRSIGPIKVSDTLEVLMGKNVFQLVEDPLNRKVNFKIRAEFARKIGAKNANKLS